MPDRLSPLDVTFLHVEDDVSHMHIGSVGLFEGPAPAQDELLAGFERKLHLAPRYRCRLRAVPLAAGRPVWADDPHFRLDYHVRRTALPRPGGDAELRRLVGRVMSHQLDRSRPLWEAWIVEGLSGGRWAVISKVHHAMVDGVSGSSLITSLLDRERRPPPIPAHPWTPAPEPAAARLLVDAVGERARFPLRELESAVRALRDPREALTQVAQTAQGLAAYAGLVRAPAPTLLNGPLGPHRRWHWARGHLDEVREIRATLGGTVNDVVLAAITNGFRELLLDAGEPVDRVVRTLVPVSVRADGESGVYDNQVSAMFADLPVGIADAPERLAAITAQLRHLKDTHQAVAGRALTGLGGFAPEMLLALGARIATRTPQRSVNTVTTNVPGPQHTLYLAGRRMLETFPYVPLGGHVRVGVAIYSYDGNLGFGVTGDDDAAPDLGVLCAGIERGLAELLAAARDEAPAHAPANGGRPARTRA
ncbi:MAG TPA: wax ester/triacylglycerol synthase family O-acyltransferase [Solirubrobacteraceae bacterium]|nr:wax ester/triacylglycerol synthase family O-acyltransferase [Solirubrobacteraceae bacterium]